MATPSESRSTAPATVLTPSTTATVVRLRVSATRAVALEMTSRAWPSRGRSSALPPASSAASGAVAPLVSQSVGMRQSMQHTACLMLVLASRWMHG